ncbi:Zn-dependent hydrolase [Citrobacter cronae]|uniref:Zn-dependent hydrolase n=1 Tax=Citrobacter TaxID=544 RepID=UPI000B40F0C1|nr:MULTISPECIES: Zn-dependent hydrolase [Citrobacter]MBJ8376938.1 Zn-dependent hydrolase [Citrobacter cronae]MBU5600424.1 Zn-dependent hydrolase [Citrobacter sp. S55_ASV_140]MCU6185034.1 Zn-dependent hydrolase [Citrobacter cronae]MYL93612.1 hydantoinase/carbamoylase family amidase [Citrobacter werkmanii]QET66646.1 Zn-dependent hydrolase [Citrobacter werkmanii]
MSHYLQINGQRLIDSLFALGECGALEGGGVCRLAATAEDKAGRDFVVARMKALGLAIYIDAIGNVTGVYAGEEALPMVMMGSHIDTVGTGGLYDGNYGVMAGLEVIATLLEAGIRPRRPLAVTFFTNEEGVRFQPDMMGSVVFAGEYPLDAALAAKDLDGVTLDEALCEIGYKGACRPGDLSVDSYVELHIEQGPILDKERIDIGVVTGVQGISWQEFTLTGVSNHAGTTPMNMRHDAGLAAAKIAVYARELALTLGGDQVSTVGHMVFKPNLINVIPNHVVMTVDLRNTDNETLKLAEQRLAEFVARTAQEEGVEITSRSLVRFNPVIFADEIVNAVEDEAKRQALSCRRLPSGAGHDAQFMASVCPAGMIFVPCVDGISHNVKEHSEAKDLIAGANVLLQVVLQRAQRAE